MIYNTYFQDNSKDLEKIWAGIGYVGKQYPHCEDNPSRP